MNKKGFSPLSLGNMVGLFVMTLVIITLASMQSGVDTSTVDKTIETLNWDRFGENISLSLQRSAEGTNSDLAKTIISIADKAVNFMGYTIFEVSKYAMRFARDNPNIVNYKVLLFLVVLALIAPLISPLFIIIVSLILIIKEAIKIRKEKRELNKIRFRSEQNG